MRLLTATLLCSVLVSRSATITADSCSFIDVSNAVFSASHGDIVNIPAGDCAWTNSLGYSKGIELVGAGIGQTIIRDHGTASNHRFIWPNGTFLNPLRIAHMTIEGGTNAYSVIVIGANTTTNIARVDHVEITNLITRGISPEGWSLSLIDNCIIRGRDSSPASNPTGISITGLGNLNISEFGGATNSLPSWDTIPYEVGTTNLVVIEDCVFDWPANSIGANGATDMYNGARMTFRNNFMMNVNVGGHGTDSGGSLRSAHTFECYGNIFSNSISIAPFSFRGGTGLFFSNQVFQSAGSPFDNIRIDNYRSSGTNIYPSTAPVGCCSPYGPTAETNVYGGGEQYGYPSYDQIGRTSPTLYTETNTVQTLQPLYQWSNTYNGDLGLEFLLSTVFTNTGDYAHIAPANLIVVEDRDYYNNTAQLGWEPLSFPHPLRGGGGGEGGETTCTINAGTLRPTRITRE